MKYIVVHYDKCHGCNSCTLACSFKKTESFNISRSNVSVIAFSDLGDLTVPVICQHCLHPACMDVCPAHAIYRDEQNGAVRIDENLCVGCKLCMMSCPIGGPWVDSITSRVMKCDLCDGDPQCVHNCGFGALEYLDADEAPTKMRKEGAKKLSQLLYKLN
jgi:Fe-S-cluster-containing dehydrogenase component